MQWSCPVEMPGFFILIYAPKSKEGNYDSFGNMWVTSPMGISLSAYTPTSIGDISQTNNRLAMTNLMYDNVGNLKTDRQVEPSF